MEIQFQQPGERITYEIDFSPRLLGSVTVSSATCSAVNLTTGAADNTILQSTTCTVTSPNVFFTVTSPTANRRYKVTVLATLSSSDILEEDVEIRCEAL